VTSLLQKLEMSICHHMRFCDSSFTSIYELGALGLREDIRPDKQIANIRSIWPHPMVKRSKCPPFRCQEPRCDTEFWFELGVSPSCGPDRYVGLVLCVRRHLGSLMRGKDLTWFRHLITEAELASIRHLWATFISKLADESAEFRKAWISPGN
jgi:hypothetical protein